MSAKAHFLEEVMSTALSYILSLQAYNGSWTEWALSPGSSATWTSAYVGFNLRLLPRDLAAQAAPSLATAARWQSENIFADGGWGYNAAVPSDADSTAYAILFLASVNLHVPIAAYTLLASFQCADGGFATYRPIGQPTSWEVSYPDVTAIALRAMLTHSAPDHDLIRRGIEYILRQRTPLGLWNSFWWDTCLYSTEASLSLLNATGIKVPPSPALAQIKPSNAFETALLTLSLLQADPNGMNGAIRDLVERLVCCQQPDGSWETAPILRITWRECYEPWVSTNGGQLCTESSRLFTTATVLRALASYILLTPPDDSDN
jgi:squalene-hopene/tetraprenyl-beta-curcumene cyclase